MAQAHQNLVAFVELCNEFPGPKLHIVDYGRDVGYTNRPTIWVSLEPEGSPAYYLVDCSSHRDFFYLRCLPIDGDVDHRHSNQLFKDKGFSCGFCGDEVRGF